jgi:hypothetical protein
MLKSIKTHIYRGHSPYFYLRKFFFNLTHWRERLRRRQFARACDRSQNEILNQEGWCEIKRLDPQSVSHIVNDEPPKEGPGKDFWRLLVDSETVKNYPDIVRFAGQDALKKLASAYLGEEAVLSDITLMKSYPTGKQIKHSQMWHLDGGDSRLLLFYVYCRDVDDTAGPFAMISKSDMKPISRPRFMRKHGYTDSEIGALAKPGATKSITGPAGTVFACDTAQTYHQGSRCETKTRLALGIRYTTFSGLYPVREIAVPQ